MKFRLIPKRHPSKDVLFDYARNMVDKKGAICASVGAHLVSCRRCAAEVDAMRGSLSFVGDAPALEPSAQSTYDIVFAARKARRGKVRGGGLRLNFRTAVFGMAYAAALLVVAGAAVAPVLVTSTAAVASQDGVHALTPASESAASPQNKMRGAIDDIRGEIEMLARAVRAGFEQPRTPREHSRQRAVNDMNLEISAAMAALERNPGCERASRLVQANLERQAETLRAIYVERGFE